MSSTCWIEFRWAQSKALRPSGEHVGKAVDERRPPPLRRLGQVDVVFGAPRPGHRAIGGDLLDHAVEERAVGARTSDGREVGACRVGRDRPRSARCRSRAAGSRGSRSAASIVFQVSTTLPSSSWVWNDPGTMLNPMAPGWVIPQPSVPSGSSLASVAVVSLRPPDRHPVIVVDGDVGARQLVVRGRDALGGRDVEGGARVRRPGVGPVGEVTGQATHVVLAGALGGRRREAEALPRCEGDGLGEVAARRGLLRDRQRW